MITAVVVLLLPAFSFLTGIALGIYGIVTQNTHEVTVAMWFLMVGGFSLLFRGLIR